MVSDTSIAQTWDNRLESFINITNALKSHYATTAKPQVRLLGQAISHLQAFAGDMFTFFYRHFEDGKLEPWDEHPPDNVYSIIMKQMTNDLEVIQRVAEQRLSSPSALLECLREADQMAARIVDLAVAGKLLEDGTQVVCYFQKSPSVRVIPYANLSLIGIPYTALDEPLDLLATPHEIGHYVFWHGHSRPGDPPTGECHYLYRVLVDDVVRALTDLIDVDHASFDEWCYVWLEEVFADVFGSWMSGPVIALTGQLMTRGDSHQEFVSSDDRHPVPLARPYIQLKALHARNNPDWAEYIDLLWGEWNRKARRYATQFNVGDEQPIQMAEALTEGYTLDTRKPIDALVDVILKHLKKFPDLGLDDMRASTAEPESVSAETLLTQFDGFRQAELLAAREATPPSEISLHSYTFKQFASDRYDWPSARSVNPTAQVELKKLLDDDTYQPASTIDNDAWWRLVLSRGWTTEGPPEHWP